LSKSAPAEGFLKRKEEKSKEEAAREPCGKNGPRFWFAVFLFLVKNRNFYGENSGKNNQKQQKPKVIDILRSCGTSFFCSLRAPTSG
jgi:hypothetical protein